ncbi:MAG: hypothetical protein E6Q97_07740 [Desulfurellales bacterium]|nr:MAG: hypothetical protein E6Q97_07740 [Desulfurellales bacterium]
MTPEKLFKIISANIPEGFCEACSWDVLQELIESRERKALAYGAFAPHRSFEEYRESPEYLSEEIAKDE